MAAVNVNVSAADRELVFTRVFDAPRDLVFQAWTDPKHVAQWFGPNGFTTTTEQMDVRPGGDWRFVMHGPDGRDYRNHNVFVEVIRPSRIVYRHEPEPGSEPVRFETTVTFEEQGVRTRLTLRMLFPSAAECKANVEKYGSVEGAKQTLARLEAHVGSRIFLTAPAGEPVILMTRMFDAPRELVFETWTRPEHVAQWWGRTGSTLAVCEIDLRPGREWRFVERSKSGALYPFKGEYREIEPPERIVNTFIYDVEGDRDHPALVTTLFENFAGKTKMTQTTRLENVAQRDAFLKSGMEIGANESFDRMDERLRALRARELILTRVFDMPREVVFRAFTEPDRLRRWFGPKGFTMPVCEFDAQRGGQLRMQMRGPDGTLYPPLVGMIREVIEPERLVFGGVALNDAGEPLFEAMNILTFEEQNGKTSVKLHALVLHTTPAGEQHAAGMEAGWSQSFDRLTEEITRTPDPDPR